MLGKLIKYEFVATSRFFAIAYPALIFMAILNRVFLAISGDSIGIRENNFWFELFTILSVTLYIGIIFAVLAGTTILMMQRFYKNMFGDEGYLMHTLPVEPWQHITSKLLVSAVWSFASFLATILSIFILAYGVIPMDELREFWVEFKQVFQVIGLNSTSFWIQIAVMMLYSLFIYMLPLYAAITIGQFWRKHRILGAVLAYLGINTVSQMVSGIIVQILGLYWSQKNFGGVSNSISLYNFNFGPDDVLAGLQFDKYFNSLMISSMLCSILISAGLFVLTNYLLKRKLDLE